MQALGIVPFIKSIDRVASGPVEALPAGRLRPGDGNARHVPTRDPQVRDLVGKLWWGQFGNVVGRRFSEPADLGVLLLVDDQDRVPPGTTVRS